MRSLLTYTLYGFKSVYWNQVVSNGTFINDVQYFGGLRIPFFHYFSEGRSQKISTWSLTPWLAPSNCGHNKGSITYYVMQENEFLDPLLHIFQKEGPYYENDPQKFNLNFISYILFKFTILVTSFSIWLAFVLAIHGISGVLLIVGIKQVMLELNSYSTILILLFFRRVVIWKWWCTWS